MAEADGAPATLASYLEEVERFWHSASALDCGRCEHYGGVGRCDLLHDRSIPDGNCLGLLQRHGWVQPGE